MFSTTQNNSDLVCALTALAFLATCIEPSYAHGLADLRRDGVYAGPAAMFGIRIPLGGEARRSAQPIVSLGVGASWRAAPGPLDLGGTYRFTNSAELAFSLRDDPVLRLGSFELTPDRLRASAEEGEASTFCGRNLGACIVLAVTGVALVAGGAFLAAHKDAFKGN
jgi:hypothetical protein